MIQAISFIFLVVLLLAFIYERWQKHNVKQKPAPTIDDPLDSPGWDDDGQTYEPSSPKPVQATLKITYEDAKGGASERIVDVKECDTSNQAGYLIGFCHLRQAIRTFRMDRIKKTIDAETGEVIQNLTQFAHDKYQASPVASLDKVLNDSFDVLRALIYIGRADGRFSAKEKQIFLAHCQRIASDERITLPQLEKAISYMPSTTLQAYKLICGRLAKLNDEFKLEVLATTEAMIATEKTISDGEAEALAYMKKRFAIT